MRRRYAIGIFLALATFALSGNSSAQVTTAIVPDSTLLANTTVTQIPIGNVHNMDGMTIRGNNQFHSFDQFSAGTGDISSFGGPFTIQNLLSRVTGGTQSDINGTMRSPIAGANLFSLNPASIVLDRMRRWA